MIYLCFCDEDDREFYVTAEGYTKNKIRLKLKQHIQNSDSLTFSLFKIYPTFYNSEYLKTKEKYELKKE